MKEVEMLVCDSKEYETYESEQQNEEKYLDCYLYGAKYYCTKSTANDASIVFDFCEKTKLTTTTLTPAATERPNLSQMRSCPNLTRENSSNVNQSVKLSILREIPHESGFTAMECEKQQRFNSDGNCFYLSAQNNDQQRQFNRLKHCFLRIYEKSKNKNTNKTNNVKNGKNRKIKLVQHWGNFYWRGTTFSRKFKPKLYKSIPFFIVLMQFFFDNSDSKMNYMSPMESVDCLLLFKNYHKDEKRKNGHIHNGDFDKCNQVLTKKLIKVACKNRDFWPKWSQVSCFFL